MSQLGAPPQSADRANAPRLPTDKVGDKATAGPAVTRPKGKHLHPSGKFKVEAAFANH